MKRSLTVSIVAHKPHWSVFQVTKLTSLTWVETRKVKVLETKGKVLINCALTLLFRDPKSTTNVCPDKLCLKWLLLDQSILEQLSLETLFNRRGVWCTLVVSSQRLHCNYSIAGSLLNLSMCLIESKLTFDQSFLLSQQRFKLLISCGCQVSWSQSSSLLFTENTFHLKWVKSKSLASHAEPFLRWNLNYPITTLMHWEIAALHNTIEFNNAYITVYNLVVFFIVIVRAYEAVIFISLTSKLVFSLWNFLSFRGSSFIEA